MSDYFNMESDYFKRDYASRNFKKPPRVELNFANQPSFEPLVPQSALDDMINRLRKQAEEDFVFGIPKTFLRVGDDKMLVDKLPNKYIINENATILFWKDESKTIVKKSANEKFNARLAFLTAYFQKHCGLTKTQANKYLDNLVVTAEQTKMKQKEVETKMENKPVKKLVKKSIRKEI